MTEQQVGTTQLLVPPAVPPEGEQEILDLSAYRSLKLYELAPAFVAAMATIVETDPSTEEGQAAIARAGADLEALNLAIEAKCEGAASIIAELEGIASAIDAEARRLQARAAANKRRAEGIRTYLYQQLKRANLEEVVTPRFTLRIWLNPEAVEIYSQADLPRDYIKTEIVETPMKGEIKKAIKAGTEIPGARLTRGDRLEIR